MATTVAPRIRGVEIIYVTVYLFVMESFKCALFKEKLYTIQLLFAVVCTPH
jgi:hypothetical protein